MSLTKKHFKHILDKIKQRHLKNQRIQTERKESLYKAYPSLHDIDNTIASETKSITLNIINNPADKNLLIKNLQQKLNDLSRRKASILKTAGYDSDYLKPIYDCKICKDTGFIQDRRCTCLTRELIQHAYSHSNLDAILDAENFDTFSLDFYDLEKDEQSSQSPREIAKQNYQICYDFSNDFNKTYQNLILHGQAGLGKTFLCHSIAKEVLDKGYTVVYLTAFNLFRLLENYRFHNAENQITMDDIDTIYKCDLLIIDDLGTEMNNTFTTSELFNLINSRLIDKKSIVISTNLSPSEWVKHYSDRIVSRIYGNYLSLGFIGTDIRLQNFFK